eukprot:TRINITY_DN87934_c0_g1_i1.p1 TRINITY_DN87934_c0_g1~~TRINITY_DN87934_c0_g1_i1.p1  ORF type:complete len:693 (+),score=143.62 TRINITY_DN87934_c0_g1_i1:33-2081(+)
MAKKKKKQPSGSLPESQAGADPTPAQDDSGSTSLKDLTLAQKAVEWLSSPSSKRESGRLFDALLAASRPLVLLRAAKYQLDAKETQLAQVAQGKVGGGRSPAGAISNAASRKRAFEEMSSGSAAARAHVQALSSGEVDRAVRALKSLAAQPEELLSKECKALRAALHPLVESHLQEEKASPAFRITSMLSQKLRWPESLRLLASLRGEQDKARPKLGAYQRWVRELNVAAGNPQELLMLDAIMRVAAGLPPCMGSPAEGSLKLFEPWAPKLLSAGSAHASRGSDSQGLGSAKRKTPKGTSTANKLLSLISERKEEAAAARLPTSGWSVLAHEIASEQVPPNHFDLDIFTCPPTVLPLDVAPARPAARHEVPGVDGAFVLSDVLSECDCKSLIEASEAMGYRPDVPLSSEMDERAHNVVLMANELQNKALFDRIQGLLPQEFGEHKLQGLNRRWRLYRYLAGNLYRKHLDGAWPASGVKVTAGGKEEYVYDAFGGGTRSKLTFIIYLNDDFDGGCTTFFVPQPSKEGTLESRPVRPRTGSATVFPHGDTGVPLLHEGSSVTQGTKYLLRTDVVYARPETSEDLKEAARLRGLARQLGGLGGKGLVEEAEPGVAGAQASASGRAGKKKRVAKHNLKDKQRGKEKNGSNEKKGDEAQVAKGAKKGSQIGGWGKRSKKRGTIAKRR